jgi:hypothetical protein
MITITRTALHAHGSLDELARRIDRRLPGAPAEDAPLPLGQVIALVGVEDALWACLALPEHASIWRRFATDCVERVRPLLGAEGLRALEVARRYAAAEASADELVAAHEAARVAAQRMCSVTQDAAQRAAVAAAATAHPDAAWGAYEGAWAAAYAEAVAVAERALAHPRDRDLAYLATRQWQADRLRELCQTAP